MRFPSIPVKAQIAAAAGGIVCSVIGGVVILKDSVGGGSQDHCQANRWPARGPPGRREAHRSGSKGGMGPKAG